MIHNQADGYGIDALNRLRIECDDPHWDDPFPSPICESESRGFETTSLHGLIARMNGGELVDNEELYEAGMIRQEDSHWQQDMKFLGIDVALTVETPKKAIDIFLDA